MRKANTNGTALAPVSMTRKQLAAALDTSTATLARWDRAGTGPAAFRYPGSNVVRSPPRRGFLDREDGQQAGDGGLTVDSNALRTAIAQDAIRSKAGVDSGYLTREDIARRHLGQGMTFNQVLEVVHQAQGGSRASQRATARSPAAMTAPAPERVSTGTGLAVLLPVENATLEGSSVPTVDARRLHAWLGVGRDFSNWMKGRIDTYGFVEGVDYVTADDLRSPVSASAKARAQKVKEYYLTLGMARELAMVENNDRGREARRYFIRCEQAARSATMPHAIAGVTPQVMGGVMKGVLVKGLAPMADQLAAMQADTSLLPIILARMEALESRAREEAARAIAPPRMEENASGFLSARGAVRMAGGVGSMRCLVQTASAGLRRFCSGDGAATRRSDEDGRWLFEIGAVRAWLDAGGHDRLRVIR